MKLDQLRKVIREEVKAAIKEELSDILAEAVEIASRPTKFQEVKELDHKWSTPAKKKVTPPAIKTGNSALDSILKETQSEMTGADAKNILGHSPQVKPTMASQGLSSLMQESSAPMPGIDISKLDFVNKAKSVLDAAYKKDKAKLA